MESNNVVVIDHKALALKVNGAMEVCAGLEHVADEARNAARIANTDGFMSLIRPLYEASAADRAAFCEALPPVAPGKSAAKRTPAERTVASYQSGVRKILSLDAPAAVVGDKPFTLAYEAARNATKAPAAPEAPKPTHPDNAAIDAFWKSLDANGKAYLALLVKTSK